MRLRDIGQKWFLVENVLLNLVPFLVVGALVWAVLRSRREPLWAEAYRRIGRNWLAKLALLVIALYGTVGFLDSLGWTANAAARRETLIDRWFYKEPERTYSAPLARMTTGEPVPQKLKARHWLGTDSVGQDVFYRTLKGVQTSLIIGGLTWVIVAPLAILLGMLAGYFGKRVDDVIQYVYTVLDSIPSILLLVALMLMLGPGLGNMCLALGVTSWVHLCRVIRGEVLKQRDREYVLAARALGVSHTRILIKHILPNMLPIVIISVTLGVSSLILSEAILSYLQIGVEGTRGSWGNMIDAARLELARDPVIWWNLASASTALFLLVLAFNVFGDALRDAVDPRLRSS